MTLGDIYGYLNTMLKKHSSGNSYSPDQFNYILPVENIKFFNHQIEQIRQYANTDKDFTEALLSSKLLRPLLVTENVTPTTGVYDLTGLANTFVHWASGITTAVYSGRIRRIDVIPQNELEKRQTNLLSLPIKHNLVAVLAGDNVTIYPTDVGEIALTYVKLPSTPVYDYYIDGNRNKIFLAEGDSHVLSGSEVGSAGQVAPTEVTSLTNEFDYGQEFYPMITEYLLSKLATRTKDQLLLQVAENEQAKDRSA